jgi:hypothetical protein
MAWITASMSMATGPLLWVGVTCAHDRHEVRLRHGALRRPHGNRVCQSRAVPVRGRASAIQQACFGQSGRAGARRGDPPVSLRRLPHEFDQARRRRSDHALPPTFG